MSKTSEENYGINNNTQHPAVDKRFLSRCPCWSKTRPAEPFLSSHRPQSRLMAAAQRLT